LSNILRIVIADDERPARSFLASILHTFDDVEIVGEAENGSEAIELIEEKRPDMALLDLQMPEIDGLGVVRLLRKKYMPLIAFVTAYDEYAVHAFEVNAIDYLLKPVDKKRLRETLNRAHERLEQTEFRQVELGHLRNAAAEYEAASNPTLH
jgi:DNA-binding LytR/AlgR family response regulator